MIKRPKDVRLLLAVSLVVLIAGIYLLINFNRRRALTQQNTDSVQENTVSESSESGLPGDFPVYPDASLESSYTTRGEASSATSVVWTSSATISDVSAFYRTELENSGWSVISSVDKEETVSFSVEKENQFGIVGIGKGEGGMVVISVTVGQMVE